MILNPSAMQCGDLSAPENDMLSAIVVYVVCIVYCIRETFF